MGESDMLRRAFQDSLSGLCPACLGQGKVRVRYGGTVGPSDYQRCPTCGGKGKAIRDDRADDGCEAQKLIDEYLRGRGR